MDILFQFSNVWLFAIAGVAFVLAAMFVGVLFRPARYEKDKTRIYECGEPTIGSSWIRYNMRFYAVTLVFLVFDVEVAVLLPVAVVIRELGVMGLLEIFFFIGILLIGFIYAWRFRALEWVKTGGEPEEKKSYLNNGVR
ncbi:MAG: NADH-quinone oxidoreductase subunit A [Candidatus Sumerlaeota bacterium]|nr:NADH-quinone oxidoreductase subunit A [Candidatus Sumerlaeota bacterium]